jgi:predicted nucleic acid-binding protein
VNIVDSCGWLEYFSDSSNASFFASSIEDIEQLIVPSISLYEVFKRILQQRNENDAIRAIAMMRQGKVIDLDTSLSMESARLSLQYNIPMADSIILATAYAHSATIWTQDCDFEGIPNVRYIKKVVK